MNPIAVDHFKYWASRAPANGAGGYIVATLPPSPFITDPDRRFVLDVEAFMAEIAAEPALEQMPMFLSSPRHEYLRAAQIEPVLRVIMGSGTGRRNVAR